MDRTARGDHSTRAPRKDHTCSHAAVNSIIILYFCFEPNNRIFVQWTLDMDRDQCTCVPIPTSELILLFDNKESSTHIERGLEADWSDILLTVISLLILAKFRTP